MDVETEAYWISSTLFCHVSVKCQSQDWTYTSQFLRLELLIIVLNLGFPSLYWILPFFLKKKNLLVYFMSLSLHPNLGRLYVSQLYPVQKILSYFTGISNAILNLDRTLSYANSKTPLIPDSLWFWRGIWVWATAAPFSNYITWDKKHYLSGLQFPFL